jgi:regulator of sigma E protease
MFSGLSTVFFGLIAIGILVFVHEMGHFIAGKLTGIRVVTFSIGFGRGIIKFDRNGTHYKLGWIPFGGYCRFAGEGEDLSDDRKGEPDEFFERPAWARLITVAMGVVFNFIFALAVFFFIALAGHSYVSPDNRVSVMDAHVAPQLELYPAFEAGMVDGDRIISINGVAVANYRQIQQEILVRPEQTLELGIERVELGLTNTFSITLQTGISAAGGGFIGILPLYSAVIESVATNTPAAAAGLLPGDEIIEYNGNAVSSLIRLQSMVQQSSNAEVSLLLKRDDALLDLRIAAEKEGDTYRLGFASRAPEQLDYEEVPLSFFASIPAAFREFGNKFVHIVSSLRLLFHEKVDNKQAVAGPTRMIVLYGEIIKNHPLTDILQTMALLSIALGFFNILPIPAADGGHIVLTIVEMIRRKRFSFAVLRRIQLVGIVLLLTIFVSVLFFDLNNILGLGF